MPNAARLKLSGNLVRIGVRRVVSGNDVERSVLDRRQKQLSVVSRAQRWIHLSVWVPRLYR